MSLRVELNMASHDQGTNRQYHGRRKVSWLPEQCLVTSEEVQLFLTLIINLRRFWHIK